MKCNFCGEEIESTDREAIHFEVFAINTESSNNGNICGECVMSEKMYKLWRGNND